MSEVLTSAELFSTDTVGASRTRYALDGTVVPTRTGGRVGAGKMSGKPESPALLVHTDIPGRGEQAIDLGAVASAIVGGVIPLPILVRAFAAEGQLDALKQAVAAHGKADKA